MAGKKKEQTTGQPEEVAVVEKTHSDVSAVSGLALSTDQLKVALSEQTKQRKLIAEFIKKHLVKGTDYIRIHVVKTCTQESTRRGSCKNKMHYSKDILAKPGQEKIFSLFQLTNELVRDAETVEMLAGTKNLVAYKCIVYRKDGEKVAEGRGAAIVGDNRRDVNATIKIAEKRARMDACLSLGFSEYFAQDLDDPDYQTQRKQAEQAAANALTDATGLTKRAANLPIDDLERTLLVRWLLKRGFNSKDEQLELLRVNGIKDPSKMNSGQAREMIIKLEQSAFEEPAIGPSVFGDDKVVEPTDEELEAPLKDMPEIPEDDQPEEQPDDTPELVVDDELKKFVQDRTASLGLTTWGQRWLYQQINGRPFAKFDKMTDHEWRRAYDIIQGIEDGSFQVPDEYVKGVIKDNKPSSSKTKTSDKVVKKDDNNLTELELNDEQLNEKTGSKLGAKSDKSPVIDH